MARLAVLCPGYPDRPGGVTDHTRRVTNSWTRWGHDVRVIGDWGDQRPEAVGHDLRTWKADAALVQYVPFLYGPRGLSRFPESLARSLLRSAIRVTTFVHEPWVPPTRIPWWVLSPLQRRQLRRLLRVSTASVTAVPAWGRLFPPPVQILPVGSTLGQIDDVPPGSPLTGPVIFSPFASGLRWPWIRAAVDAVGASPPAVVIGAEAAAGREHAATRRWFDASWEWSGRLDAAAAFARLYRAPLVLAPFIDGLTARRTSALAALSAGARVISSSGPLFDPTFENSPVSIAESQSEFVADAVRNWEAEDTDRGRALRRRWFSERFDDEMLDRRLLTIVLGEEQIPQGDPA